MLIRTILKCQVGVNLGPKISKPSLFLAIVSLDIARVSTGICQSVAIQIHGVLKILKVRQYK